MKTAMVIAGAVLLIAYVFGGAVTVAAINELEGIGYGAE